MADWLAQLLHPDLATLSASAAYAVLFVLIFVESGLLVGFFLPGDTVLFAAGLLSARPGSALSLEVLALGAGTCAVLGDAVGYWTGRRFGRPWVERRAGRAARHLPTAERFYARWGVGAVVVARFIPWVRTFTPILAGVSRMRYPSFLAANVAGALLWATGLVVLGHVAYSVPWVRHAAYAVAALSVLTFAVGPFVARRRRDRPAVDAER
ncbi:MAG TPA: DedA family protein [Actinomycetales bacterium]|nr:DedA family protein [Actinomycetales bacterium]